MQSSPPIRIGATQITARCRLATCLATGVLLALPQLSNAQVTPVAESALNQAEVAVAEARVHAALWSTAWKALLEARRSRLAHDAAATLRWSARATELAELGLIQAGYPNQSSAPSAADTNGDKQ